MSMLSTQRCSDLTALTRGAETAKHLIHIVWVPPLNQRCLMFSLRRTGIFRPSGVRSRMKRGGCTHTGKKMKNEKRGYLVYHSTWRSSHCFGTAQSWVAVSPGLNPYLESIVGDFHPTETRPPVRMFIIHWATGGLVLVIAS